MPLSCVRPRAMTGTRCASTCGSRSVRLPRSKSSTKRRTCRIARVCVCAASCRRRCTIHPCMAVRPSLTCVVRSLCCLIATTRSPTCRRATTVSLMSIVVRLPAWSRPSAACATSAPLLWPSSRRPSSLLRLPSLLPLPPLLPRVRPPLPLLVPLLRTCISARLVVDVAAALCRLRTDARSTAPRQQEVLWRVRRSPPTRLEVLWRVRHSRLSPNLSFLLVNQPYLCAPLWHCIGSTTALRLRLSLSLAPAQPSFAAIHVALGSLTSADSIYLSIYLSLFLSHLTMNHRCGNHMPPPSLVLAAQACGSFVPTCCCSCTAPQPRRIDC